MSAPTALKSDKGQGNDRGPLDGSSSEFSEDDTPLAARLNLQGTYQLNDTRKQLPRPILPKKPGFVIPRKKKQANELLQVSNFNTRDGKELLRNVVQSYRDPNVGASFKFDKLELVYNDQLSKEYQEKKQCMRNEWRNQRELEDKHAFLYTLDRDEAKKICEAGLEVGSTTISCLGDPSMGVYLCRHADVISKKPLPLNSLGYLIVFKVIKGKVKPVTERLNTTSTDLLEPTPNFDCHVSKSIQSLPANTPLGQVFEYSQYYFYEFAEEGDDLHVKRPRQCLPYAVLTFSLVDPSAANQELPIVQDETSSVTPPVPRQDTRILDKRRGRSSHVLWMGKIANKDRILADAQLVCHSVEKIKLPFDIGEKIVMKEKISFQQLRPFLNFPLFRAGPPSISKTCQVSLAGGTSFLHCDLIPVEDDHGKIKKLVKFFQEKNWAGIVKCPDANRVIFLIPTSQITLDLGITTVESPAALHVLLFLKKLTAGKGSTATSVLEPREIKTVSQIQNELKRQLSDVKETRVPTEQRRLSQDSARPKLTTVCSASTTTSDSFGSEFDKELTSEQTATWQKAVEHWLSRPHPLKGTDAESQRTTPSSSVSKTNKVSFSAANVPKPKKPAVGSSLSASFQDGHARPAGSTEQHKVVPAKHTNGNTSRQLKSDTKTINQDGRPPVAPLMIRKVEHREDPRLKRRSLDVEPSPDLKSPQPLRRSYSMPYNAEEALQAQGVTVTSTSVETMISTSASSSSHVKYQVNDESLRSIIDKLQLQKRGDSAYEVNLDEGIRRALELLTTSSSSSSHVKYQVNEESLRSIIDKLQLQKQGDSAYQINLDEGTRRALELLKKQRVSERRESDPHDEGERRSTEMLKQREEPKRRGSVTQDHMDTSTSGKLDTTVITSHEKSVKKDFVSATDNKGKKVNSEGENVSVLPAREQDEKGNERRKEKRRIAAEKPENKRAKFTDLRQPNAISEVLEKPVHQSVVPELSDDPFPVISSKSLETLKSPPSNSNLMSKTPKLKLILSKDKNAKETSVQLPTDDTNSSEPDLTDQVGEAISQQGEQDKSSSEDRRQDRKSIESPVAMDISPSHTTSISLGSISPITVVSAKGRYNQAVPPPVPPPVPPTTPAYSTPAYPPPVLSSFPFSPPVPQGPCRNPISPIMPPGHPMQFGPSSTSATAVSSLPGVPPISSMPSSGSMPFVPRSQPVTAFPPTSGVPSAPVPPMPPTISPSFPVPPPPAAPGSIQRSNSADSIPSAPSSSPRLFPPTFQGQQWTSLPNNQGFGFPQPFPARPRVVLPPAVVRPQVFPQQLGGPPQTMHLPRSPAEGPVVQPQGLGFVAIGTQRLPVPLGTSQGTPFVPPLGPHPLPPMGPAVSQLGIARMTPVQPIFGAPPQFMPRVPFQQPSHQTPVGFWDAPLLGSRVGRMPPHQSPGKKHSSEPAVSSSSHKSGNSKKDVQAESDGDDGKQQTSNMKQEKNSHDSGPKEDASLHEGDTDKPSGQAEKSKETVLNKTEVIEDGVPKSQDFKQADSTESEVPGELLVGGVEKKAESGVLDKTALDNVPVQEPVKLPSDSMVTPDHVCGKDNQNIEATEEKAVGNESTKQDVYLASKDDDVSKETGSDIAQPSKITLDEGQDLGFQGTVELSGDFPKNVRRNNYSVSVNSDVVSEIPSTSAFPSVSMTDYITEAEQTSTKARSKIYDILRRNAYDSRPEASSAEVGAEDPHAPDNPGDPEYDKLDYPDDDKPDFSSDYGKLDDPDYGKPEDPVCEPDADMEEDVSKEEKLLFSGEESATSEQGPLLESGLRVVQVLDLGESGSEKEREKIVKESSMVEADKNGKIGKAQEERLGQLSEESRRDRSHQKRRESLPRNSTWEDISDESDEGTPERDLPGFGSVDIEFKQLWTKTVETATAPASPKPEVVHIEADTSTPATERIKSYVTLPSQKRRRQTSTSSETEELSSPRKLRRVRRVRLRDFPDQSSSVESAKKPDRDKQRSLNRLKRFKSDIPHPRESNLPSRIVSDAKEGTLKITILQDSQEDKRAESPEAPELMEETNPLADMEYSDLEDISPGKFSSEDEDPPTPDTPETATPAMDFTHPSLGFWAAPLGTNEMAKPTVPVVGDHQASGAEILPPMKHLSYLDDQPHPAIEQSHIPYDVKERNVQGDVVQEPFTAQAPWPVEEGFFCQTTTSEERDFKRALVGQSEDLDEGLERDSYLMEDTVDQCYPLSPHETEDETSRYAQEFPQSEVYDYGHGKSEQQQTKHRNSGHTELRSGHKGYKQRSSTRVSSYYPWKAHGEGKNSQPSTGGEGIKSADQSVTGKSTGSEKSRSLDDRHAVKRRKLEKGAHSSKHENSSGEKSDSKLTSDSESVGSDKPRNWEVMIFSWMNKYQFTNWLKRKQHGAKLAADAKGVKNTVIYTPETVRRSSERLMRRAKKQLRQRSRSSSRSPAPVDVQTSECPDFDFDDLDLESNLLKVPSGQKEESDSCVLKEKPKDNTLSSLVSVNDDVEKCTVHSNGHPSQHCTVENEDVHRSVDVNADDACKEAAHIDLICDKEVSAILESGEVKKPLTCNVLDYSKDTSNAKTEQLFGELPKDPATESKAVDVETSVTSDAEAGSICEQVLTAEASVTKLLDSVINESQPHPKLGSEGEDMLDLGRDVGSEVGDDRNDEEPKEQHPVDCDHLLSEAKVNDCVSQHDQDIQDTQNKGKGIAESGEQASVLDTKDTVTEEVEEVAESNCEGIVANSEGIVTEVVKHGKDTSLSGGLDDKEGSVHDLSPQAVSLMDSVKATGDVCDPGKADFQANTLPECSEQRSVDGDSDKAHVSTQDADETNANCANKTLFEVSSVMSSDQLSQHLSTVNVFMPAGPGPFNLSGHHWSGPTSLTAPFGPLSTPITTQYPVLPPLPANVMWPGVTHAGPMPTTGIVPAHIMQPNYGFPSWNDHAPHVLSPVGCVQPPLASDHICPPGTEDTSKVNSEDTDENQPHKSVMDQSVVTALMQFYSEINEVEESDNKDNEKVSSDSEVKTRERVPKPQEVAQMIVQGDGTTSDLEVESDLEGSHMDVSEDGDVSEIEEGNEPAPGNSEGFGRPDDEGCKGTEAESTEGSNKWSASVEGISVATMDVTPWEDSGVSRVMVTAVDESPSVDAMPIEKTVVSVGSSVDPALSVDVSQSPTPSNGIDAMQAEHIDVSSPLGLTSSIPPVGSPSITSMDTPSDDHPLSPIDPVFLANAERTIFSSIGDLKNLLGQSSSFDHIAEEAIASTVFSLEDVLRQAQSSYHDLSSCPSDSGVSAGEEGLLPSKSCSSFSVPLSRLQGSAKSSYSGTTSVASEETRTEGAEMSHSISKVAEKQSPLKKPQKARKKFHFFVYSPEHDRECEAVKNYMLKAGGMLVDIKDSVCLEENSRELKVLIRRKHLPSVHRLANLFQLKMASCVKFALFNTLTDVMEGSRLYENIFVSGGALLADDTILKTIEIDHLEGLLRFLKEQSLQHQKFVWVLNISRNGYKRLCMHRPLTKRDSKVLNLLRRYRDEGFITVLPKGYVTEGIPATQRYLQTSLKLQIELISVYRHIILLSDMDKNRVEVPWFLERGIGVMNIQEFLTTFAGESEAKNLLAKQPLMSGNLEATLKDTCTVMECFTPEGETPCPTPEGTPVSDASDSPVMDTHGVYHGSSGLGGLPRSDVDSAAPQKRAVRSLSWDAGTMTQTRLQILSCVRSVRDNIRSQISSSSPSSPVSRSM